MYYLARLTTKLRSFIENNTTLTQLEHSGNFGLITEEPVLTGLVKIQKIAETYNVITGLDEQEAEMTYPFLGKLFDASVFNTMETGSPFVLILLRLLLPILPNQAVNRSCAIIMRMLLTNSYSICMNGTEVL